MTRPKFPRRAPRPLLLSNLALLAAALGSFALVCLAADDEKPAPPQVVAPGPADAPGAPPADAVILFDGSSLDHFTHLDGRPAEWNLEDGAMVIKPGSGGIISKTRFADAQLHIEFATPAPAKGEGQGRGNSGVYLQARYEVQVLDSCENETYPDGQCGAVYGQHVPLVNVCRPPGQWQTYDIVFHPPVFDEEGTRAKPGTMTVFHNGALIHDDVEIRGATTASPASEAPADGPLYLQDHGSPVRYRNIWLRHVSGRD